MSRRALVTLIVSLSDCSHFWMVRLSISSTGGVA